MQNSQESYNTSSSDAAEGPEAEGSEPPAKKQATSSGYKAPSRARRWAFTLFGENLDLSRAKFGGLIEKDSLSYICFQQEVCPKSGKNHLQGYMEFLHGRTLRGVKSVLAEPSVHLSVARDDPATNRAYCSKPGGSLFVEYGRIAPGQGWRTDLEAVRESLCGGVTGLDLWDAHFSQCTKYYRAFDRYEQLLQSKKRARAGSFRPKRVTYICGPSGSGKTSRALDQCIREFGFDAVYVRPSTVGSSTDWFEGLTLAHRAMVIDEFAGDIKWSNFLRVLDGYPHLVERKGSSMSVDNIEVIYITSNRSPHEVYPRMVGAMREPFYRRINNYVFMDRWREDRCPIPDNRINELRRS